MTPTPYTTAALLLHRERIQDSLRKAATRPASGGRRKLLGAAPSRAARLMSPAPGRAASCA